MSQVAEVERLFDATIRQFGRLDILVNNAGIMFNKPLADVTEEEFDRIFAVNVKGTFFACQQAARRMADGGRIVNFSSSTTALMLPTYAAYVATKGAVEQLSHVLAKELGSEGDHRQRRLAGADRHGAVRPGQDRAGQATVRPDGGAGAAGPPAGHRRRGGPALSARTPAGSPGRTSGPTAG